MARPHWCVRVATDDAKILELSINADTGQLFVAVSDSGRSPEHVATFNQKTAGLDRLIEALLEATEQFDEAAPANQPADLAGPGERIRT